MDTLTPLPSYTSATKLTLCRFTLPLTEALPLRGQEVMHRIGLLVRAEHEDGRVTWGEISPLPGFSREGLADTMRQARAVLAKREDGLSVEEALDAIDAAPSVRCGYEQALWPVEKLAPIVTFNALLTGTPERVRMLADRAKARGYKAVKVKVGRRSVEEDLALVRDLSKRLGPEIDLRLDANRAWTFTEAQDFAEGLLDMPVAYLEEPLKEMRDAPLLADITGLRIALDESLSQIDPERLRAYHYAKAIVLKPMLIGWKRSQEFAAAAEALGMDVTVSAAFETGIGLRHLATLAPTLSDSPAGLDTYRFLEQDLLTPRLPLDQPAADVARLWSDAHQIDETLVATL
jgi:O-succinylbenzoate synthase